MLAVGRHTRYTYAVSSPPHAGRPPQMSIRQGLLALLEQGPMYGYQLRAEFESRTGATWPLNVGQVYTTLGRLERDGLVEPAGDDGEGHAVYRITDGRPGRGRDLVQHPGQPQHPAARRAGDQAGDGRHGARRRRTAPSSRASAPRPSARCRTTPGSRPAPPTRRRRRTWPGCSSWSRWSSPPRPRSAGSTTARRGWPGPPRERPDAPLGQPYADDTSQTDDEGVRR